jgi:undecaprenyl-diphosphatase
MNAIDLIGTALVNAPAGRFMEGDQAVVFLSRYHLFKGGVLVVLLWWAWFSPAGVQVRNRCHVIATLAGCLFAVGVARGLQNFLPIRARPLQDATVELRMAYGMSRDVLDGASSFPSDHAVLFFSLAVGLLFVSRAVGVFAICYSALFIALPRVYLGLHFPTDVLAGAMVGAVIALLANRKLADGPAVARLVDWAGRKPQFFYPMFFLLTYQIAELFEGVRALVQALARVVKSALLVAM